MKIQQINQQQNLNNQPRFTGVADAGVQLLRFLDTNQAWGATAVDFSCMVAPRTITDFTRGPQAGVETFRREASGTINHAAVGLVYGPLAGLLLAAALNGKYGIKAQNIFADSDAVDILSKLRFDVLKSDSTDNIIDYSRQVASSISTKDAKKFLSEDAKEKFAQTLAKEIKNPAKENKAMLKNIVLSDLGEEANILLKSGKKEVKTSLNDIVDNVTSMSKALFKEKVVDSFKHAAKFEDVNFVKAMKNFGLRRRLLYSTV